MKKIIAVLSILIASHVSFAGAAPLFPNSVVSNDLEFIKTSDASAFSCITFKRQSREEMPDKRGGELFDEKSFVFLARYSDGASVELWAHSDFETQANAQKTVRPVAEAIGKLPTLMRAKLDHVVLHKGNETAFGEHLGHFFVVYSDNIATRIRNHDLEETVFHESVHATLDAQFRNSGAWRAAQQADRGFITEYAARLPDKEDLAESALFAWALLVHPGRLPAHIEEDVKKIMPHRLGFFEKLFLKKPLFYPVKKQESCL